MKERHPSSPLPQPLNVFDDDAVHDVGDVVKPVDNFFQVIIDLVADEECHGIYFGLRLVKFRKPMSCNSSAWPSSAEICAVRSLILTASELIELSSGTACCTSLAHLTIASRHVLHLRRELLHVEKIDRLCSLLHLIDGIIHGVIRSRMLPRSKGVMKVRRTAISTSRVALSASCSRSITV